MELRLASTVVDVEGGRKPLFGETLSHDDVLATAQFSVAEPRLVKEKLWTVTVKGPPAGPLDVNPDFGVTWRESGGASALIRPLPAGVPHPVQRS